MSVHYKFKSNLDHDTVTFDGLSISVADLKKAIMQQKKIGKSSDFDLQITNAQTKEVYDSDDTLVPKNTSIIVARVPAAAGSKSKNWDKPDLPLPIDDDDLGKIRYDRIVKNADIANTNASEEDKVKAMITQSSQEYDPSKFVKSRSMTGPLPPSYTCFRCGKQGHWIKNCPTNNPDVKRSTGIPRSFMVPVDGPEHKGALLTSSGDFAVPLIDHQAYKEVKKEKPPFVQQDEPVAVPEAEIPEELLCMVCKDLLQDAVLIPCCGNSFCDECVRQVLIESDNHECPECHETDVSPNTLIPNRFLRTAVLNFKNETGYTRAMRMTMAKSSPMQIEKPESPQPSPDSTVETQPHHAESGNSSSQNDKKATEEKPAEVTPAPSSLPKIKVELAEAAVSPKREPAEEIPQPGTPLADEPPVDFDHPSHPIQAIGQEKYHARHTYHSGSRYHRNHRDDYHDRYSGEENPFDPKPISTIETITNLRKGRGVPGRPPFTNQRGGGSRHEERDDGRYNRDNRVDYYERSDRYDRRHTDRSTQRSGHSRDYHHADNTHYEDYSSHSRSEERRHQDRYRAPAPHPASLPPAVPAVYPPPPVAALPPIPPPVVPAHPVYPPQPPPPGASPVDIASQPPPPGVGPLLPTPSEPPITFAKKEYKSEEAHGEAKKIDDRSIDDKMEAFQRELEKRGRESRDRESHSRSRSSGRERSRSSSRSRSYSSSKSWSRSVSRSSSRSPRSRSRSRTPVSSHSRSRSRSYTQSRSRSWSKVRSYTRSRSRTRTESSRSRSRSWTEPRFRRKRSPPRERIRSPRPRSHSRSYSPRSYRSHPHPHRVPFPGRHHSPPHHGYGSFPPHQSQYPPPPIMPVMRPDYPPHHVHPIPPQPMHTRPIEHYPMDRPGKFPPYPEMYPPSYDMYQHHQHPRYDREQRQGRYDRRQEYQKEYPKDFHQVGYGRQPPEIVGHRIPGYIGERSDYKPRYRQGREPRKDIIRELPQISEPEMRQHTKEPVQEQPPPKKKEEKAAVKHKKHHHHHKGKENKKQVSKTPVSSEEKQAEASRRSSKTKDVKAEKVVEKKSSSESVSKAGKSTEKPKEKKHKHKKHKTLETGTKKKKSIKKEKGDASQTTDSDAHAKVKTKKRKKLKVVENTSGTSAEVQEKVEEAPPTVEAQEDPKDAPESQTVQESDAKSLDTSADMLDIFPDEGETAILSSEGAVEIEVAEEVVVQDVEEVAENEESAVEKMEEEEVEEEEEDENVSEEEVEETVEESDLHVDVPALSKWEREEMEDDVESRPQRRSSVTVVKEEKESLPSDIIHRAELAILSKPLKPQITLKEKDSKAASDASSPENATQSKELELKSVVNTDSSTLQVTISTSKEKRSVHPKRDEKTVKESKRKSEKSNHRPDESRKIASSAKIPDRSKDARDRRPKDSSSRHRTSSKESKDRKVTRRLERDVRFSDERLREERRQRFAQSRSVASSRDADRSDRNRVSSSLSGSKQYEQYTMQPSKRGRRLDVSHRSSSISSSTGDQVSHTKRKERHTTRKESDHKKPDSHKPTREVKIKGKYSPVKPPEKHSSQSEQPKKEKKEYVDDTKFEPDYEDFSDMEESEASRQKLKRKSTSPEPSKKRARLEKGADSGKDSQKGDVSSSASSSGNSGSESSDSDDQKGSKSKASDSDHKLRHKKSKHKKHKKHKHRHKKKKSHKSKRE